MTQPNFNEGPPVPLMTEGVLDEKMLQQLASDLLQHTTILHVREKGSPNEYADPNETIFQDAFDRVLKGRTRAIQIRYRYDGFEWSDTIMALPHGFRMVRCRHENS